MGWILLVEDYEKNYAHLEVYTTEYEICSEVRISGVLDYGNGFLLCYLLEEKNKMGLYTYGVQVKSVQKEFKFDESKYTKDGYCFKDGLIGELMALFSVFFQARFYLKATNGFFTSPNEQIRRLRHKNEFHYRKPHPFFNYEMFSDQKRNWAYQNGLGEFLDTFKNIDGQYHQSIIRAFYWYAESIKEIGVDHQLFFIKMVSSVEALLKYIDIPKDDFPEKIKMVINKQVFNGEQKDEIEKWLQNRKIRQKFSIFLSQYSKGFFKGRRWKAKHCHIYRNDVALFAKKIYDARSAYLHVGNPMYLSDDLTSDFAKTWDLDVSMGMMVDRKEYSAKEKLPRTRWFERITNHCLKSFMGSIQL